MIKLNARGTIIECEKEIVCKSKVLDAQYKRWPHDKPFFLDYDPKTVHLFLDYLKGHRVKLDKIRQIADNMMVDIDEGIVVLTGEKITQIQQRLESKYNEFVDIMKNKYGVSIDIFNSAVMLSMMSYYLGFQLREVTDLNCVYNHFLEASTHIQSINTLKSYGDILETKIINSTESEHIIDIGKSTPYTLTGEYYVFEKNMNYFEIYSIMDLFKIVIKVRETKLGNGQSSVINITTNDIDIHNDAEDITGCINKLKTLNNCTIIAKRQGEIKDNNYKVINGEFKYVRKDTPTISLGSVLRCPFILTYKKYTKIE